MNFLTLMFSFKGRATRAQFWLAALVWAMAVPASYLFAFIVMENLKLLPSYELILPLVSCGLIPTLVSFAAVGARRLHDRGKSGLWMLVFFLVPYIGAPFLVGLLPMGDDPSDTVLMIWLAVTSLPMVWGLVELGLLPGTPGPNRFGEAPSSTEAAQPI